MAVDRQGREARGGVAPLGKDRERRVLKSYRLLRHLYVIVIQPD
jgi:hypothetical protein